MALLLFEFRRRQTRSQPRAETDPSVAEFAELLLRVGQRDITAFPVLYKRTSPALYGIVHRILRRPDLAGDALQQAYENIWLNAARFDGRLGSPLGWMATIARNTAVDMARHVKPISLADMPSICEPSMEFGPPLSRDRRETLKALLVCLSKLDARKQELIMRAYYYGASREELAHRMGVPVPTIKTQLRQALLEFNTICARAQI